MSYSGSDADAGEDANTHHVCMFVYVVCIHHAVRRLTVPRNW